LNGFPAGWSTWGLDIFLDRYLQVMDSEIRQRTWLLPRMIAGMALAAMSIVAVTEAADDAPVVSSHPQRSHSTTISPEAAGC
jgi:hypothetical protein